jgi:hypothetical protein
MEMCQRPNVCFIVSWCLKEEKYGSQFFIAVTKYLR